ncbi:hypothetical protein GGI55_001738 [Rhizobium leguminosarum]|uniref:SANT/Myb-like DNA-binding domain-containing protein n=1 Tax=Rhizobium TaxID=379 RepID=UPI00161C2FCB|nr:MULTISPECIES: SANT/Myb-like DNA-binding domain-containing protein [Rhizobium]MBB4297211.1 hypothetical protein [Rhizobium leguminosarum]MBB4415363.1 hypothetical protein [Rhizobium leguminosarum]MBB4431670.1 hypothetical protein [Rhizobium esperanzae]MBB4539714.1 hypothetical protein [Rhizobium leguminosarum]MBB5651893.1 hypothetical protein [Rhizobium leguminosarum]
MSLAYYARNAASAERARRRMRKEGFTMRGQKLWTEDEFQIIREIGPNFDSIRERLPHRTRVSIESQCRKMGFIQKPQHAWSAAEISKLRKLYPAAIIEEICQTFPHSTWVNIRQVAQYHGFRRARRPFKPTGNAPVDEMLAKLFEANLSFHDLDKECRTKRYFQKAKWRYAKPNYNRLVKAIELLDGELAVRWRG